MKNTANLTHTKKHKPSPIRALLFLILLCIAFSYYYYTAGLKAVATSERAEQKEVIIAKGSSLKTIARTLEKEKLIRNSLVFEIYSKLNKTAGKMKAGKYQLSNAMTVSEIVDKIASGKALISTVHFTIPEGFNLEQIITRISETGVVTKEDILSALSSTAFDYDFVKQIPDREKKLEGYLFPDTYEVYKDATAEEFIGKMLQQFDTVFTDAYKNRAKELNMTVDQVITLASIIEREAKHEDERKTISGVFHNRLKKGMMLQSCATVQYLLKEQKEILTYKDLEIDSPYNTYKNAGLPPGPIASPGKKSIEAALYPEDVDYLYFVAKPDGSHVFTKTYNEHLNAQNKINR